MLDTNQRPLAAKPTPVAKKSAPAKPTMPPGATAKSKPAPDRAAPPQAPEKPPQEGSASSYYSEISSHGNEVPPLEEEGLARVEEGPPPARQPPEPQQILQPPWRNKAKRQQRSLSPPAQRGRRPSPGRREGGPPRAQLVQRVHPPGKNGSRSRSTRRAWRCSPSRRQRGGRSREEQPHRGERELDRPRRAGSIVAAAAAAAAAPAAATSGARATAGTEGIRRGGAWRRRLCRRAGGAPGPRQVPAQEARRQGAGGFQRRPQGNRDQAPHGHAADKDRDGQSLRRQQDGAHGAGKGNPQGRGNGRRGKGGKGKPPRAAQQAQAHTEKKRQNHASRATRAAQRFQAAAGHIWDGLGDAQKDEQPHHFVDRARDPLRYTADEEDN